MPNREKKILIIDEQGFSRICSAILEDIVGFETDIIAHADDLPSKLNNNKLRLIVTSYPYGAFLFDEIKKRNIPTIILSDNIDGELIELLSDFNKSYCMIKPLDYDKFKTLVKQVVNAESIAPGGRTIV